MRLEFEMDGATHPLEADKTGKSMKITLHGKTLHPEFHFLSENCCSILIDTMPHKVYFAKHEGRYLCFIDGEHFQVAEAKSGGPQPLTDSSSEFTSDGEICAPMPGKLLKILVKANDQVEARQSLAIVEAMKMEHDIRSPIAGVVKKINFSENDLVATGQPLMEITPDIKKKT